LIAKYLFLRDTLPHWKPSDVRPRFCPKLLDQPFRKSEIGYRISYRQSGHDAPLDPNLKRGHFILWSGLCYERLTFKPQPQTCSGRILLL